MDNEENEKTESFVRSTKNDNLPLAFRGRSMFAAPYFDDFTWLSASKCTSNETVWTNVTIVLI